MNNDLYSRAEIGEVEKEALEGKANLAKKINVLSKLIKSNDFKFFLKEFIEPRLLNAEKKLKTLSAIEIVYRAQGAVEELEFMTEGLSSTLEALKNTTDHA